MSYAQTIDKTKLPPMLQQYLEYKEAYSDCLLLFQVGDFYEAFFDDAIEISQTLNLTLTSRDKNSDNPIPMSGVPIAVIDSYLDRLVAAKMSVAIVSQASEAKGKGMVARKLERIVTPGVQLLGGESANSDSAVASLYFTYVNDVEILSGNNISIAFTYPQSGKISVYENLDRESLIFKLSRIMPTEIILPRQIEGKKLDKRFALLREIEGIYKNAQLKFRTDDSISSLNKKRDYIQIPGYATLNPTTRSATRLLLNYIDEVTVENKININSIEQEKDQDILLIDSSTRENLDLIQNQKTAGKKGSLFAYLDRCVTAGGKRLLKQWLLAPSTNLSEIQKRQASIQYLLDNDLLRKQILKSLEGISDLERSAARIDLGVVSPRELSAVTSSLEKSPQLIKFLESVEDENYLSDLANNFTFPEQLFDVLKNSLAEQPPATLKEGGVFRQGYNEELDRYMSIRQDGKSWIAEMEAKERQATGISSLKIKFNNVHNYFFEVTKANLSRVPEHYIKKQTTVNYERFYTPELKKLEEDILSAETKQLALEKKLYEELKAKLLPYATELREFYSQISLLDVLLSLAETAVSENLTCPELCETNTLNIQAGRHPIIAQILKGDFVANSIDLDRQQKCIILTGPNMGGKSTYLRQVALIVVMAQIGSFVPAESASIGIVDRIFARIGASDDLHEGESTFMVEMREAAQIISMATDKSLILIDELGRGTATTDGMAIARAVLEWIITSIKARTLFATHFHALTNLEDSYPAVKNSSVGSVDLDGQVVFTHEICSGPANKSYGLEVAKLAGLPNTLIDRANNLLAEISKEHLEDTNKDQLSLFQPKQEVEKEDIDPALEKVIEQLKSLDLNTTTPLDALTFLNNLKNEL